MKNLIIILGTIMLGALIFTMMVGNGSGSLKNTVGDIMVENIRAYAD